MIASYHSTSSKKSWFIVFLFFIEFGNGLTLFLGIVFLSKASKVFLATVEHKDEYMYYF